MRPVKMLTIEELASAYEMRHGYDRPTPWKYIAKALGVGAGALFSAIKRLERTGVRRDANGRKPLSRPTRISDAQLLEIDFARRAGNTWPQIADALGLPVGTVQSRYSRWRKGLTGKRE